jgi:RNA polymerase sigma factor (sigma-70 family)
MWYCAPSKPKLSMQAYNEAEVLRRLSEGDERALEEIMLRYREKVFNVARRFLRSNDLAVEIVQEVFITVWFQRQNFADSTDIGGYCRTLARNKTIKYLNKILQQNEVQYEFLLNHLDDQPREFDLLNDVGLLETYIEKLSPQQKVVLKLKQAGATYTQIAEQMNISAHTVKFHLHEARQAMRLLLKHHLPVCIFTLSQVISKINQL